MKKTFKTLCLAAVMLLALLMLTACGKKKQDAASAPAAPAAASGIPAASVASAVVGNHIAFGNYPQTLRGEDNTPIEWRVLDVQDGRALIISEYLLDWKPFNTESHYNISWEKCTMRQWLNSDFLNRAFSASEQAAILTTTVKNDNTEQYYDNVCKDNVDTQDKIFLLSYAETNKYWSVTLDSRDNMDSRAGATDYAKAQGLHTDLVNKTSKGQSAAYWWLRSTGPVSDLALAVTTRGALVDYGLDVSIPGVRPALWLDLSKL